MKSSEPCPYAIGVLHSKISTSSNSYCLTHQEHLVKGLGKYVKHLKKLPLCVFGGHLVSMYSLLKKEDESYTYYSRIGGKFMLTYISVRSMPLLKEKM
jgi:hypothetical protein